eukprot:14588592-Alexandrium_andersonii.AAC.1
MSASLVGSEMCIRDRCSHWRWRAAFESCNISAPSAAAGSQALPAPLRLAARRAATIEEARARAGGPGY